MRLSSSEDLVSIIVVSHDYGRFLGAAIESALAQTYSHTEVIVVDDGSADNSVSIATRYPVKIIAHPEPRGVAQAVDTGIRAATGEYYVLLSADDMLHADYVRKTHTTLAQRNSAAFAYTQSFMFGADSGLLTYQPYDIQRLLRGNFIPGTALTRRKVYHLVGGYDPTLPCLEDWDHWLNLAERRFYGVLIAEPLFHWRRHAQGSRNMPTAEVLAATIDRIRRKHWRLFLRHGDYVGMYLLVRAFWRAAMQRITRMIRARRSLGQLPPTSHTR